MSQFLITEDDNFEAVMKLVDTFAEQFQET